MKYLSLEDSSGLDFGHLAPLWGPGSEQLGQPRVCDSQEPNRLAQQVPLPPAPAKWWLLEDKQRTQEKYD